jgi:hypothetical protein
MQSVELCYKYQPGIQESTPSQGWFHLVTKHLAEERLIEHSLDNALLITYTLEWVTVVNTGISCLPLSICCFVQLLVSGTPLPISSCPSSTWRAGCLSGVRPASVAAVISIKDYHYFETKNNHITSRGKSQNAIYIFISNHSLCLMDVYTSVQSTVVLIWGNCLIWGPLFG